MKSFFKSVLATMVGILLLWTLLFFTFLFVGIASLSSTSTTTVSPNSLLEINLNGAIVERVMDNPFDKMFDNSNSQTIGLNQILTAIESAKTDDNIKGISLYINNIFAPYATIEELRNALIDFRTSGKFVYAYSEMMPQKSYYLATAGDSVFLHPQGSIIFSGLSAEVLFFKQLLQKLEIEPQIIRHGEFKSAIEPFVLDKMSSANREQMQTYINSTWERVCADIAKSRKITIDKINATADSLTLFYNTPMAVTENFIDGLYYSDEYELLLKKKLKVEKSKDVKKISLSDYSKSLKAKKSSSNQIAVIYATGDIMDKEGDYQTIGYNIAKEISKARQNKTIKAIVLRVNSGGGSALMSDIIWREVMLCKNQKSIVVSMGDYAASGGYYISCAADYIVAQPTTLTGSIGVFGVIPNIEKFLSNKLGITTDNVKTNMHADALSLTRPMSDYEKLVIQKSVENVYDVFLQHVSQGRNMTVKEVDAIAQGRVWTGADAMKIGLVDTLGGLDLAIRIAAERAKIENYTLVEKPFIKNFFEEFTTTLLESKIAKNMQKTQQFYQYYDYFESLSRLNGIQARIPFIITMQ